MRFPVHMFPMSAPKGQGLAPTEKQANRALATDYIRNVGTGNPPSPPRDVQVQSAPRGIKANWALPVDGGEDITGWVIYGPDGVTPVDAIPNRSTRTYILQGTAGTVLVGFVAAQNAQGIKSYAVRFTGTAIAEAGAPVMPDNPPGWTTSSGSDTSDNSGDVTPPLLHG